MSYTRMTTVAIILSELSSIDCLSCNALYFEYCQEYFLESIRFCRSGRDNVLSGRDNVL